MIKAGIIGATGYAGVELVKLLLKHPKVTQLFLSSVSFEGQRIEDIYGNLLSLCTGSKCSGVLMTADEVVEASDVVFTALPHGIAEQYADVCIKNGKKLIDLSADFRFDLDEKTFTDWYKKKWDYPAVHEESVYGLPEMQRDAIKKARVIGNPGCYVTSATLALLPAVKNEIIELDPIIVDSKSGVTGTGRNATMTNNFSECGESIKAYGVGKHRHQPEIAHNLTKAAGKPCGVIFTPHLLPMSRGIISTCYAVLKKEIPQEEIQALYEDFYKDEPFVRVLPAGTLPETRNIRCSNFCDVAVFTVHGGKMLETVSVLDNMVKGASGQAVQNMNLLYGFPETDGIDMIPSAF